MFCIYNNNYKNTLCFNIFKSQYKIQSRLLHQTGLKSQSISSSRPPEFKIMLVLFEFYFKLISTSVPQSGSHTHIFKMECITIYIKLCL